MRMRHAAVVAGLALGLMSGAAQAAIVEYTSQTAFNAATPGLQAQNFSGFSGDNQVASPFSYGPLTFSSSDNIYADNDGSYGSGGGYVDTINQSTGRNVSLTITLSQGFQDVGFNVGTFDGADTVLVSVDGSPQSPFVTLGGPPMTSFIGFMSGTPIKSLTFSTTSGSELDVTSFELGSTSLSSVPLPASAPMFGAALMTLGAVGYGLKRKGKASA